MKRVLCPGCNHRRRRPGYRLCAQCETNLYGDSKC